MPEDPTNWRPSPQPARYDEERVVRLRPIRSSLDALGLPPSRLRKLHTILNALEMQIEDGGDHPQVNGLLLDALRAGVLHQVGGEAHEQGQGRTQDAEATIPVAARPVLRAIETFARSEETRWEQARAGTLSPIVLTVPEQVSELVQDGYDLLECRQTAAACDRWLAAWSLTRSLITPRMRDAAAFDARYPMLQSLYNWSGDLAFELANAGLSDPRYYEHLVRYAQEYLAHFPGEPPGQVITFERQRAEALWALDRRNEAEAVCAALIERFPDEGWAYIGWSDLYWLSARAPDDYERAAAILQQALARPRLRDREDVLMRVGEVREVQQVGGRPVPSARIEITPGAPQGKSIRPLPEHGGQGNNGVAGRPPEAGKRKPGRNAPCWCGSGKKYKHCHLDADSRMR